MKIDETASKEIENFVVKILEKLNIPKLEKENIRKEFSSHVYESAREIAQKRNSDVVEIKDVESAKDEMESVEEIASSLSKSYADSLKRAGFLERFAAYAIDIIVFALILGAFIFSYTSISEQNMYVEDVSIYVEDVFNEIIHPPFLKESRPPPHQSFFNESRPPTFLNKTIEPDADKHLKFKIRGLIAGIPLVFVLLIILLEGTFGTTIGKKLLGMSVLNEDGTKIGYKKAVIRNIPKIWMLALAIDALFMVTLFKKEKQRGFDRIPNTIVVKSS